jgi:hypothetical protein
MEDIRKTRDASNYEDCAKEMNVRYSMVMPSQQDSEWIVVVQGLNEEGESASRV